MNKFKREIQMAEALRDIMNKIDMTIGVFDGDLDFIMEQIEAAENVILESINEKGVYIFYDEWVDYFYGYEERDFKVMIKHAESYGDKRNDKITDTLENGYTRE